MKKKIILMVSLLAISCGLGLFFQSPSVNQSSVAYAKTKKLKSFPKAYRHTWYRYVTGRYQKLIIKTTTLKRVFPGTYFNNAEQQKLVSKKMHGHTWVVAQDMSSTAGTKFSYRTTTKKWSGKKHKAIVEAAGSDFTHFTTYYSSKTHHK